MKPSFPCPLQSGFRIEGFVKNALHVRARVSMTSLIRSRGGNLSISNQHSTKVVFSCSRSTAHPPLRNGRANHHRTGRPTTGIIRTLERRAPWRARLAGLGRRWKPHGALVKTNDGACLAQQQDVGFQNVFHVSYKLLVDVRDAQFLILPGLERFFRIECAPT